MTDLKILSSHPIQYQAPLFRALAASGLDIEVAFYHRGTAGQVALDVEFGVEFEWDVDLLGGYRSRIFLDATAQYHRLEQLRLAPQLVAWALRNRDVPLLLCDWSLEVLWTVWLLRLGLRAPTLVFSETTPLSFQATPKPDWRVALLRALLSRTPAAVCIGQQNRAFLVDMGLSAGRIFHAPYSIENARFTEQAERLRPDRAELCRDSGLDPELPVFLFCGKLIHKKRPLQLLEAYLDAGLAQRAQLLFVGDGQLRSEIERRAREAQAKHVHLLGFLNQSQMPLAYVLGEVLCLISDPTETWGLVVNEALACQRPVIVSETCGCCSDLVNPDNGWRVALDDQTGLRQTLSAAFAARAAWPKMGEIGFQRIAAHTFEAMAQGIQAAAAHVRDEQAGVGRSRALTAMARPHS